MNQKNIENILLQMGIPANVKGFRYIVDSMLVMDREGTGDLKFTYLYHLVAKKNRTTIERVERAIRHALSIARKKGIDHAFVEHYIGFIHKSNSSSLKLFFLRLKEEEAVLERRLQRMKEFAAGEDVCLRLTETENGQQISADVAERLIRQVRKNQTGKTAEEEEVFHLFVLHDKAVLRTELKDLVRELLEEIIANQR